RISYDEMLELSGLGASVLQTRAVEFAKKYNVKIHVRNSQHDNQGTWIVAQTPNLEHIVVSGAALKKDLTRVTIKGGPDRPGIAQRMFKALSDAKVNIQNITTSEIKISCIIDKAQADKALQVVHDAFELEKAK